MRILAIRLCNLNSLTGSWTIDFTAPEYAASGIFAITGPTGAGKSTILDAVCLALFARTPRLGHISKSSNEILSRRAGHCFAEVEFETQQGSYRCHWGQHRARRSAEGDLQPPRHEIVDARNGKVLETRSKEVSRLVEQVTGMDYDRFTRSILLAQGDFAAFLEADADQRAPILEQITGTGIYSRISIAIHERTSEERKKTALLQEAMGAVFLLADEDEKALAAGISQGVAAVVELRQHLALLGTALHRIQTIRGLQEKIKDIDRLLLDLARRREEARGELLRLDRGQRARFLTDDYTRFKQNRDRIAVLHAKGKDIRAALERLQQEHRQVGGEHARACQQVQEGVATQSRKNEVIKAVRALDLRLHEKKKAIAQVRDTLQQMEKERHQRLQKRQELAQRLAETAARLERFELFFREHANDSLLVEHLTGFRQQLLQLGEWENNLHRLAQIREGKDVALAEAVQNHIRLHQLAEQAAQAAQEWVTSHQRQHQLLTAREELLAGQDAASWRLQVDQGEQRFRQLEKTGELLDRQRTLEKEQAALGRVLQDLQTREQQRLSELRVLEEQLQAQQQLVTQSEHNHRLALRIHSYEDERRRLMDGAPCPLCGAVQHPWADERPLIDDAEVALGRARADWERMQAPIAERREALVALTKDIEHTGRAIDNGQQQGVELTQQLLPLLASLDVEPAPDHTLLLGLLNQEKQQVEAVRLRVKAIDELESELQAAYNQTEHASAHHAALLSQVQAALHARENIDKEMHRLEEQVREERVRVDRSRSDLLEHLQPLRISECPPGQAGLLLAQLEARQRVWKEQQQHREQGLEQQGRLQAEQDNLDLLLTTMEKPLVQQSSDLEILNREEAGLQEERLKLFGNRHPDVEEQKLKYQVQQTEAREVAIRNHLAALDREIHSLNEQVRIAAEELECLLPESEQEEAALLVRLAEVGFDGLTAYCQSLLPPEELVELGRLKEGLDREQTVLAARKAEQIAALGQEERHQGQKDQVELLEEQQAFNRELEALQQRIGADRERLAANNQKKGQFEEQGLALAAQQRELGRWEVLHQLIGSADGKKFRIFAQGLTFDAMISHANRQLRKMNDRYILLRDPWEPLALQVIDNYQAGETRSTRNLSGGESFLVSLALSLGLSAMASHNVRVDSLFLDEGFGTLDEEALDTALQTLAELQQDGKLIGIISHVPMLKDRIDVRIQVLPGPDGNSRLLGPGCRHSS